MNAKCLFENTCCSLCIWFCWSKTHKQITETEGHTQHKRSQLFAATLTWVSNIYHNTSYTSKLSSEERCDLKWGIKQKCNWPDVTAKVIFFKDWNDCDEVKSSLKCSILKTKGNLFSLQIICGFQLLEPWDICSGKIGPIPWHIQATESKKLWHSL